MTEQQQLPADTRNLQWKTNNRGSKLLQKMGWKEGQAVGKRRRREEAQEKQQGATTATTTTTSTEGLRVVKRQVGLGIGAESRPLAAKELAQVQNFSSLLAQLQEEHGTSSSKKKKKKKTKKKTTLPTNKLTNSRVRQAKFDKKSAEDMKCIFGGGGGLTGDFPVLKKEDGEKADEDKKKGRKKKRRKHDEDSQEEDKNLIKREKQQKKRKK